jgi:hypothetical protein
VNQQIWQNWKNKSNIDWSLGTIRYEKLYFTCNSHHRFENKI